MIRTWLAAFRLRTLPLAFASVVTGGALARVEGAFSVSVFGLCLLTTLFLQVLSNLANDYGDFMRGTDGSDRIGPARSVQSGAISPRAMRSALVAFAVLSLASGVALLLAADLRTAHLLGLLALGLTAIWAAIAYTVGRNPYGYRALGDVFVFLFFGLVGVYGTAFLLHGQWISLQLLPAAGIGLLAASVLHINNMRDHRGDARSGKRTLAVVLGFERSKTWFGLITITAFVLFIGYCYASGFDNRQYLWLITAPLFAFHIKKVLRTIDPADLDPLLKRTVLGTFALSLLFLLATFLP